MPPAASEAVPQQQDQFPAAETRPPLQETQQIRIQEAQHIFHVILLYENIIKTM